MFPSTTQELPAVDDPTVRSHAEGAIHIPHEVEKLLRLAESLSKECDRQEFRSNMAFATTSFLLASVFSIVVGILFFSSHSDPWTSWTVGLGVVALPAFSILIGASLFLSTGKKALQRDKRAINAIVNMLREVVPAIIQSNQLSVLEQTEINIRLARFDIGIGTAAAPRNGNGMAIEAPREKGYVGLMLTANQK